MPISNAGMFHDRNIPTASEFKHNASNHDFRIDLSEATFVDEHTNYC